MNKFRIVILVGLPLLVGVASFNVTHALFSSSATSANNTFSAMTTFPTPNVTPSATPTPGPDVYVDQVASVSGTFGHPTDLSDSLAVADPLVTGAPDLQFIQLSDNSTIVLAFVNNKAVDGDGADIKIHIIDTLFPSLTKIEVGPGPDCNASAYSSLGEVFTDTAPVDLEISGTGYVSVQCVRITELPQDGDPYPNLGFDLDAVEALHSAAP